MKQCPFCDTQNEDTAERCRSCGIVFSSWEGKTETETENTQIAAIGAKTDGSDADHRPPNYSNGGLIAWSVITILLCLIPGIIGLVYAVNINSCETEEEQEHKASVASVWCLVGTILGILSILIRLAAS